MAMIRFYKYHGAGNDFLLADNRAGDVCLVPEQVASLCDRRYGIGADGLMLIEACEGADFRMVYYNSDGSGGMMCGNGGRCIVAFASDLGIVPSSARQDTGAEAASGGCNAVYSFVAADGMHLAEIVKTEGAKRTVRLKMTDVHGIIRYGNPSAPSPVTADSDDRLNGYFLDTGTRHFVKFVNNLKDYDVRWDGVAIRNSPEFAPVGTNVNFVEPVRGILNVRTYEKGVEDETCACGTGITAAAIATFHHLSTASDVPYHFTDAVGHYRDGRVHVDVRALKDMLAVDFRPVEDGAEEVWLTGPAVYVAEIIPSTEL